MIEGSVAFNEERYLRIYAELMRENQAA